MSSFPSPQQHDAITRRGNVLVSAAAGSGKTSVLVARIVRAATDLHVPLTQIAAITFTELAAGEIRERVTHELQRAARFDLLSDLERAPIGTIHNFCARYLRQYAHAAGVDPDFSVLDEPQARYLRRSALRYALDAACAQDPAALAVRARYGDGRLLGDARNRGYFDVAHDAATQRPDGRVSFVDDELPALAQADARVLQSVHEQFVQRYAQGKLQVGGLDFDDLQLRMLDLLADEQVLTQIRRDVACLLVDEFQDTNRVQVAIVDRLGIAETFAVGDEWQSIYRFRKADVAVFRERAAAADVLRMDENYRSSREIIETVNDLFGRAFVEHEGTSRYEPVRAMRDAEQVPVEIVVAHEPDQQGVRAIDVEFNAVARRIRDLIDTRQATAGEIAILMCASTKAAQMRDVLTTFGVDSVTSQSKGFGDQLPVRDVLALLSWVRNRHDARAAYSVLASPYVGMRLEELYALRASDAGAAVGDDEHALTLFDELAIAGSPPRRKRTPLWQALHESDHPLVRQALALRERLGEIARTRSLVELVSAAIHDSGYAEIVLAQPDGARRYAQLRKLLQVACEACELGHGDVASFLDLQAMHADAATDYGEASIADEHTGAVRIMTFHAAKGLEFPHVFVVDCANTGNSSNERVLVDRDGLVRFELVDAAGLQSDIPQALRDTRSAEQHEEATEERRKYYVALTRAQRRLVVSSSLQRTFDRSAAAWITEILDRDDRALRPYVTITHERELARPSSVAMPTALHAADDPPAVVASAPQAASEYDAQGWRERRLRERREREVRRRGERLHALLARAVDVGSVEGHDAAVRALTDTPLATAASTALLRELCEQGTLAEVPVLDVRSGELRASRLDAYAGRNGDALVVDWKSRLPADRDDAYAEHAAQIERYRDQVLATGASSCAVVLCSVDGAVDHTW